MTLDDRDIERFSRQLLLPSFGEAEQLTLSRTRFIVPRGREALRRYLEAAGGEVEISEGSQIEVRPPSGGRPFQAAMHSGSLELRDDRGTRLEMRTPNADPLLCEALLAAVLLRELLELTSSSSTQSSHCSHR